LPVQWCFLVTFMMIGIILVLMTFYGYTYDDMYNLQKNIEVYKTERYDDYLKMCQQYGMTEECVGPNDDTDDDCEEYRTQCYQVNGFTRSCKDHYGNPFDCLTDYHVCDKWCSEIRQNRYIWRIGQKTFDTRTAYSDVYSDVYPWYIIGLCISHILIVIFIILIWFMLVGSCRDNFKHFMCRLFAISVVQLVITEVVLFANHFIGFLIIDMYNNEYNVYPTILSQLVGLLTIICLGVVIMSMVGLIFAFVKMCTTCYICITEEINTNTVQTGRIRNA
jgi:hypothetical protein